jgi:pimeloyl-ACP methyl ester carboxylesterase
LLKEITAPTLILWGADDAIMPVDHGRRMAAAIPNAKLITYDGVGHIAQEEASEKTISDLRAFLASFGEEN